MPFYFDLNFGPLGDTLILIISASIIANLNLIIQPFGTIEGNNNWSAAYNPDCNYDWNLETYQARRVVHPMECSENYHMQSYLFQLTIIPSNILSVTAFIAILSLRNCYRLYVFCIFVILIQTLLLAYGMHIISTLLVDEGRVVTRTHVSWLHLTSVSFLVTVLHVAFILHRVYHRHTHNNSENNKRACAAATSGGTTTTYTEDGPSTPLLRLC